MSTCRPTSRTRSTRSVRRGSEGTHMSVMRRWIWAAAAALLLLAPSAQAACRIGGASAPQKIDLAGRSVLVHLPAGFDGARRYPLLFLLHGSGGTGAQMLARSGLAAT